MAKKIEGGFVRVDAQAWQEGKKLAGFLKSIDTIPNCDSRKVIFETEKGKYAAVWETAAFARQLAKMTAGSFYRVECLGKVLETANGAAWDFNVEEAENQKEIDTWTAEYRTYVAGGGK